MCVPKRKNHIKGSGKGEGWGMSWKVNAGQEMIGRNILHNAVDGGVIGGWERKAACREIEQTEEFCVTGQPAKKLNHDGADGQPMAEKGG